MAKAYLVIRIKGQADVPYWANTTLRLLKLEKKYRATILPIKENTDGMLKKIQHFVSWQEIDLPTTKELLDKKGRRSGYKKITAEDISEAGFKTIDELATSLSEGKINMTKIKPLKPWFAYHLLDRDFNEVQNVCTVKKEFLGIIRNLLL